MSDLRRFLQELGCFNMSHSGRSLGDHLLNTYELLRGIGAAESTAIAGGLHAIFGTNLYRNASMQRERRALIVAKFGERAAHLCVLFSRINRPDDLESGHTTDHVTQRPIQLTDRDLYDLRLIEAVNLAEQGGSVWKFPAVANVLRDHLSSHRGRKNRGTCSTYLYSKLEGNIEIRFQKQRTEKKRLCNGVSGVAIGKIA